jgi:hypothetical protein
MKFLDEDSSIRWTLNTSEETYTTYRLVCKLTKHFGIGW